MYSSYQHLQLTPEVPATFISLCTPYVNIYLFKVKSEGKDSTE